MSVGSSRASDAGAAGKEAVVTALQGKPGPAKLLLVLASPSYDLPVLLGAITAQEPGAALIGCTTAGEIFGDQALSGSVVVTALGGEGFQVATGRGGGKDVPLRTAAAQAARCLDRVPSVEHTALILLSDGLGGDQEDVVRGAYDVAGAGVPLVGGSAGDDGKMETTFQFCDGEVVTAGVVSAAITSDAPFGIGIGHGWRKIGAPLMVTSASATQVHELDGRPALDAYLDHSTPRPRSVPIRRPWNGSR